MGVGAENTEAVSKLSASDAGDKEETGLVRAHAVKTELEPTDTAHEDRGTWGRRLEFVLASVGYAVGLGNVWRFPYLCYRSGGGAFLIPYVIMLFLCGIPLLLMEFAIGVGLATVVISFILCTYYNVLMTWALYYLFNSFGTPLPWQSCNNTWNLVSNCSTGFPGNATHLWSSSQQFFDYKLLEMTDGIERMGELRWELFGLLVLAWIIVYLCIFKGVKSTGKVVYFTATFPYFILFTLLINNVQLPGANDGILYFLMPNWGKLLEVQVTMISLLISGVYVASVKIQPTFAYDSCCLQSSFVARIVHVYVENTNQPMSTTSGVTVSQSLFRKRGGAHQSIARYPKQGSSPGPATQRTSAKPAAPHLQNRQTSNFCFKVWVNAAAQIFNSIGIAFGSMISMASYNKFNNNIIRDTLIVALANSATSILAGFVIFSAIGYMAHVHHLPVDNIATDGPGLVFVVYPEIFSTLPVSQLWASLFFLMLLCLGLDSQFAMVEVAVTCLMDCVGPKLLKVLKHKELVVLAVCTIGFLLGIPHITQGGIYVFQLMDHYTAVVSLMFLAFFEVLAVCWIFGVRRIACMVERMLGKPPNAFFQICWLVVSPLLVLCILISSIVRYTPARYGKTYTYPAWAEVLGWFISLLSIVWIPLGALHELCTSKGKLLHRLKASLLPTVELGGAERQPDNGRVQMPDSVPLNSPLRKLGVDS